jgi:hypothetical protein
VRATDAASALGLRVDDVVLVAGELRVDTPGDAVPAPESAPARFVVWRRIPGERPVLPSAVLGRQSLEEFIELPPVERTPMRLAVMLANRATLARDGGGLVLLPAPAAGDDEPWRTAAALLPAGSEAALQEVSRAIQERVDMPAPMDDELQEAQTRLAARDYLEAEERAQRALLAVVADPARRHERPRFEAAYTTWIAARTGAAEHRARLLAREPLWGVLIEGRTGRVQAFLPQHTLLEVENSASAGFAAGVRVGWPFGDLAVIDDMSLIIQYAQTRNGWRGPRSAIARETVDILDTTLHEVNFELMYRPRVASRLKPYLRAGAGIHTIDATIHCDGTTYPVFNRTGPGFLFGGGLDVWRWTAARTRLSVGGAYRLLRYEFTTAVAPDIEPCRNTLTTLELNVGGRDDLFRFDMSGWQAGLVLAFEL